MKDTTNKNLDYYQIIEWYIITNYFKIINDKYSKKMISKIWI
jgi:hypothetical protein